MNLHTTSILRSDATVKIVDAITAQSATRASLTGNLEKVAIKVPGVVVTQTIPVNFMDENNHGKKRQYEESFLEQSLAGEGSYVTYRLVAIAGRRLANHDGKTGEDGILGAYLSFCLFDRCLQLCVHETLSRAICREICDGGALDSRVQE